MVADEFPLPGAPAHDDYSAIAKKSFYNGRPDRLNTPLGCETRRLILIKNLSADASLSLLAPADGKNNETVSSQIIL